MLPNNFLVKLWGTVRRPSKSHSAPGTTRPGPEFTFTPPLVWPFLCAATTRPSHRFVVPLNLYYLWEPNSCTIPSRMMF